MTKGIRIQKKFWTSYIDGLTGDNRSFLGVTGHWVNNALERENVALSIHRMRGSNTYDKLAEALTMIMQEYGIQNKTQSAITDSGMKFNSIKIARCILPIFKVNFSTLFH